MSALCRDCFSELDATASSCAACGGNRVARHAELSSLTIAHLDCDAFYAAIETRDNPALAGKAVIVGGGKRGVVLTCSYPARVFGVRSAMPMFQALKLCPNAIVVPPNMGKYAAAAREIRAALKTVTPLVEPVSLDEAYLDLSGTERLHGVTPASTMMRLAKHIEDTIGITVSIGLSCNKYLAKLASDLDKPRGFAVIGRVEAKAFLRDKPVAMIRGVGPVLQARLAADGIHRIAQIQDAGLHALIRQYGDMARWLHRLAHGEDDRPVDADGETKSVSAETTFEGDIKGFAELEAVLWDVSERLSARAKAAGLGGRTVTLKLKTARFKLKTRSASLEHATQLCDTIFRAGRGLLLREVDGAAYRLLGIGLSNLVAAKDCDPPNLLDYDASRRAAVEHAVDDLRAKFGDAVLKKGRSLSAP